MSTIEDLRDEYRQTGIGPLLYELLEKVVWSTVRRYPASVYSPHRAWDQVACEDVLHDWIVERLWGRADLQSMLSSAATLKQLRAALTTSLSQHLTNKRRRSIAANLYKRVRSMMLEDGAFRPVGSASLGAGQGWTLPEHASSDPSPLSIRELLRIASDLSDDDLEVVRYGPFSQKLSPILRGPKLREFLVHLLGRAKGSLTLSAIVDIMRLRFSLPTEEQTELDDTLPSPRPDPADEAVVNANARSVVSRLDADGARLLAAYFMARGNFGKAAESCCSSLEQVREVVHGAFGMICDCSDSPEEARATMQAVESLLLQGGD
jgi:hypothetical protein